MPERINLDDPAVYARLDPQGMLERLHDFPQISSRAWQSALKFKLPPNYARVNKVVVLGMGGSAIGGDLIAGLIGEEARIPFLTCREYVLPAHVDENSLVIASSYSGATEETLSAFQLALTFDCPKLAITTGGRLKELCTQRGLPVFSYEYPAQPRAALPYSFFPLLAILTNLALISDKADEVRECLEALKQLAAEINEQVPEAKNEAKALARQLLGKLAVIYGGGLTQAVAERWKSQLNENSKCLAFYEYFSELNHNAVVGYTFPRQMPPKSRVVMLSSDWLHPRVALRYEITQELLERAGIASSLVASRGKGRLSQMMTLVLFGDYVSYYLAMLNGADPTAIGPIDFLKKRLAEEQ